MMLESGGFVDEESVAHIQQLVRESGQPFLGISISHPHWCDPDFRGLIGRNRSLLTGTMHLPHGHERLGAEFTQMNSTKPGG